MTAQELKDLRKANELTQKDLADILNVAVQTVKHWEQGVRNINKHVQFLIELVFRIKPLPDFTKYKKNNKGSL